MTLVKWNPAALDREIDSLVRSAWGPVSRRSWSKEWSPRIDITELEDHYEVNAEVPGLSKEDINVTLAEGVLRIEGEKKRNTETRDDAYRRTECFYGKFSRSFSMGDRGAAGKTSAAYKDGVLTVTLSKAEEAKRKVIDIEVS